LKKGVLIFSILKSVALLISWGKASEVLILGTNLLLSAALGYYYVRKAKFPLNTIFYFTLEALAPVFSTVGLIIAVISMDLIQKNHTKKTGLGHRLPFGEEHYSKFISNKQIQISHDFESSGIGKSSEDEFRIEPFLDIIEGTDLDLKINAIGKLASFRTIQSITLLKLALNDEHYEVRYFASNSLSLVEKAIVGEIEVYNRSISRSTGDFQNYSLRGLSYLSMYYLGVIDVEIGGVFLEKALYDFLYSLQLNDKQDHLYVKILEVYKHLKDFDRILDLSSSILSREISEEDRVKILFYEAEAYFNQMNFDLLKKNCLAIKTSNHKIHLMNETVDMWSRS
jgi:hypothetical protein